jgi:hypothetical protein
MMSNAGRIRAGPSAAGLLPASLLMPNLTRQLCFAQASAAGARVYAKAGLKKSKKPGVSTIKGWNKFD